MGLRSLIMYLSINCGVLNSNITTFHNVIKMDLKDVRLETCIKYMPGSNKKKPKFKLGIWFQISKYHKCQEILQNKYKINTVKEI